eukprot:GHVP01004322.1.p2 GENE.GHVP01004322.1~~GHVP01004322.1.p2  ORF type:complete len:103 (-),score=1.20 GHVP01004322.1:1121-1429(-)
MFFLAGTTKVRRVLSGPSSEERREAGHLTNPKRRPNEVSLDFGIQTLPRTPVYPGGSHSLQVSARYPSESPRAMSQSGSPLRLKDRIQTNDFSPISSLVKTS